MNSILANDPITERVAGAFTGEVAPVQQFCRTFFGYIFGQLWGSLLIILEHRLGSHVSSTVSYFGM